jgi:general secretion pathway protein M
MTFTASTLSRRVALWLANTSRRERTLLGSAAILLAALFYVGAIWRPLMAARGALFERIEQQQSLIAVMRSEAPRLRALAAAAPSVTTVPAATAITQEAAAGQMTIQRLDHEGTRLRVVLDNTEFPALIAWINRLETVHGLRLVSLELERRPDPGLVSARISLEE